MTVEMWAGVAVAAVVYVVWRRRTAALARKLVGEGAVLVDVRTEAEFFSGHLPGAKNIPVHQLGARSAELGPTSQAVVVYCASGARSAGAAMVLRAAGFKQVVNLGPMSAW
jgi:phage shock protein E